MANDLGASSMENYLLTQFHRESVHIAVSTAICGHMVA